MLKNITESLLSLSVWSSLFVNNLKMCPGFLSERSEGKTLSEETLNTDKVNRKLSASNLCANFLTLSDTTGFPQVWGDVPPITVKNVKTFGWVAKQLKIV